MNEKIQTNENGAEKSLSPLEQQALLRDIDYCFGLFLKRLKDEEAEAEAAAEEAQAAEETKEEGEENEVT
jgi:hypothetical protein